MKRFICGLLKLSLLHVCQLSFAEDTVLYLYLDTSEDLISLSHGGGAPLPLYPAGIASLADTEASDMLALTCFVRDEQGKVVGIASELETFKSDGGFAGSAWKTDWTIMLAERGSLYVHQWEQVADVHQVAFESAASGTAWTGNVRAETTVGPLPNGRGLIVGGTGEFAGAVGEFIETAELRSISGDGVMDARIELKFLVGTQAK
ncbi:MAG: hypothetical protein AAGF35_16495 [Pseudomonadota bacterium]